MKQKKEENHFQLMEKYHQTTGHEKLQALYRACPSLASVPLQSRLVSSSLDCFELKPDVAEKRALELCSYASSHKTSNLGTALDGSWQQMHSSVSAAPAPSGHEPAPDKPCLAFGLCVCRMPGKAVHTLRNRVHQQMKHDLMGGSQKKMVLEGFVVMQFTTEHEVPDPEVAASSTVSEFWFHIGLQYMRPFRSTYHQPCRVPTPPSEPCGHVVDAVFLQVHPL